MTHSIAVESRGPVCRITLNRPDRHNAFDDALVAQLTQVLRSVEAEDGVRVVVLTGAGRSFCAGADLEWMRRIANASQEENRRDAMALATLMRLLADLHKPTIARVQGSAYGGGVGLVACCDIAIAETGAKFALSEARLGLIPAVISPYVIAAIGARAARRYFLTAETFAAPEARRLGLIHEIAEDEAGLDASIERIAQALLECGPAAQVECKALIQAVGGRPVSGELIQDTAARIARVRASAEGVEGVSAFLEKRRAAWLAAERTPE